MDTTKKVIRGTVPQKSLSFYNETENRFQSDIWNELCGGLWKKYNIDNRIANDALGEMRQTEWEPVLPGIIPQMPGFVYDPKTKRMNELCYQPHVISNPSREAFMSTAEAFFRRFEGERIGVHLSGGLDSSLIMCLLHYFGISFCAVGLASQRYEFRTERRIQDIIGAYAKESELLDIEEYPFYGNLDKMPKHQIPDSNIKMNDADGAVAETLKRMGCTVVLTGQGGDTLLADAITQETYKKGFNIRNEFCFPWEEDFLYAPKGLRLISFFSDETIIDHLVALRFGHKEDPLKLWARHYFADLLPRELSEFCFCGDFNGHSKTGLEDAKPTIKLLFEEAYETFQHPLFSPESTRNFVETNVFTFDYKEYCDYCTKISIAAWLHSLFRIK